MDYEIVDRPLLMNFAEWAAEPGLRCSEDAIHQARLSFVDTLACMMAGARDPLTSKTADAMILAGASGPVATVLDGVLLSAPAAALVNGVAAHALDFDDYETPASTHPSAVIIPALLAVAELRPVSLGALAIAYLVGYEAIVRTGRSLGGYAHYLAGWHATSTIGPIGAAAATAKLIGLPDERFATAISLAMSTSAGLKLQFGTDAKPIHAGFAARAGVEAALLAESGLTANLAVMEGDSGFLARYGSGLSLEAVAPHFRERADCAMDTDPVLRKPWPSCSYTHRTIEASLRLAHAPGFDTGRISQGVIRLPEPFFRVAGFMGPKTPAQARFSTIYCVASALSDGALTPKSFDQAAIERPKVRALMARFEIDAYNAGPDLTDLSPASPDSVSLRLTDGSVQSETQAVVKGGGGNPLSQADIRDKFAHCGRPPKMAETLLSGAANSLFRFSAERWA